MVKTVNASDSCLESGVLEYLPCVLLLALIFNRSYRLSFGLGPFELPVLDFMFNCGLYWKTQSCNTAFLVAFVFSIQLVRGSYRKS